jgi:hypothetical protein
VESSIYGDSWYADRSAYAVEHNIVKTEINFFIFSSMLPKATLALRNCWGCIIGHHCHSITNSDAAPFFSWTLRKELLGSGAGIRRFYYEVLVVRLIQIIHAILGRLEFPHRGSLSENTAGWQARSQTKEAEPACRAREERRI